MTSLPLVTITEDNKPMIKGCDCCQNTGIRTKYSKKNIATVYYCSSQEKLQDLEKLIKWQEPTWDAKDHIKQLPSHLFEIFWTWLIHYKHKRINQGYIVSFENKVPNLFQTFALIALWRLKINPVHYCLGVHTINDFIKMTKNLQEESLAPVIFLEQRTPFWKITAREEFDYIANWCKNSGSPLWLSLFKHKEEKKDKKLLISSSLVKFKKRIQQKKDQDQLEFLKETTLNSLKYICKGYHPGLQKEISKYF
jgi:hypothetical protein